MNTKQWTKKDYKLFIATRSDSVQDFLHHVISKIKEYDEERFIKEYGELPRANGNGGSRRSPGYGKREWKLLKLHGY